MHAVRCPTARADRCPWYSTWPAVGATRPSSSRASVVLPLPLSPTMAVIDGRLGVDREREVLQRDGAGAIQQSAAECLGDVARSRATARHADRTSIMQDGRPPDALADLAQLRPLDAAARDGQRAARMERAAGRQIAQQRRQARNALHHPLALQRRQAGDQHLRVGMPRRRDDLARSARSRPAGRRTSRRADRRTAPSAPCRGRPAPPRRRVPAARGRASPSPGAAPRHRARWSARRR